MTKTKKLQTDLHAEWRVQSACRAFERTDPSLFSAFVNEQHPRADEARSVCTKVCKVRSTCLVDAALDTASQGLRAGYYFDNGAVNPEDLKTAKRIDGVRLRSRRVVKKATEAEV